MGHYEWLAIGSSIKWEPLHTLYAVTVSLKVTLYCLNMRKIAGSYRKCVCGEDKFDYALCFQYEVQEVVSKLKSLPQNEKTAAEIKIAM
jgi:hypothetical protein